MSHNNDYAGNAGLQETLGEVTVTRVRQQRRNKKTDDCPDFVKQLADYFDRLAELQVGVGRA